jgi:NAD(P)-dependent dehydrogenase (short-subunit alcohol dehydrogenase family)
MSDLSGKAVMVTGASRGLGRHFALTLARHGGRIALCARDLAALETVKREIVGSGGTAMTVSLDVTSEESVHAAGQKIKQQFGGIDVLINNSGVTLAKPVLEQTGNDWDTVIDTNLKGAFLVATEVARSMVADCRGGSIVNIASILGCRPMKEVAGYAVSKAGLIHLTRALGLELARYGIRVNAIAPGFIPTEINDRYLESEASKEMIRRIPQRRLGKPEDLDGALLLLASDASSYMTGIVIPVDGGHLISQL